eukprot:5442337-Amphidinium_carterae.2
MPQDLKTFVLKSDESLAHRKHPIELEAPSCRLIVDLQLWSLAKGKERDGNTDFPQDTQLL